VIFRRRAAGPAPGDRLRDYAEQMKQVGIGLLSLEVNTILKPGMSAQKMPEVPVALHVIIDDYAGFLRKLGVPVTPELLALAERRLELGQDDKSTEVAEVVRQLRAWKPLPDAQQVEEFTNGPATFEAIYWAACAADSRPPPPVSDRDAAVLERIRSSSRQVERVVLELARLPGWDRLIGRTRNDLTDALLRTPAAAHNVEPALAVVVRKVWDIGTEEVLFQTVLQLDGDVVMRMSPYVPDAQRQLLFEIHRRTLDIGVAQWKGLFEIVASLIRDLGKTIFARPVP
jgi:hypothetical protein